MIPRRTFLGSATLLAVRPGFAVSPGKPGAARLGLCSYSMYTSKATEVIEAAKAPACALYQH